jgi:hypothetical protein
MKFTRTAGLATAAAVLIAGGVTAGFLAGNRSSGADRPAADSNTAGPSTAGSPTGIDPTPGATPSTGGPGSTPSDPGLRVNTSQPAAAALTPAQVTYQHQSWGDPKTEVGVVILAPKGWSMVKLSTFEVRFSSPNKLWNLRVNAGASDLPVKTIADREQTHTGSSTQDYKLISRVDGTTKATNPNFTGVVFHHTTLTYSYTDPVRGARLVVERFVSLDDIPHTLFELSAGGRPQDAAALAAITNKATEDFIRLP